MDDAGRILALTPDEVLGTAAPAPDISPQLLADLRRDEGCRFKAYPDPLSGGAPFTIGFGHTGPEVKMGLVWTPEQCEAALIADVHEAMAELDAKMPWWRTLDPVRRDVICNMTFNLGIAGLLGFQGMLRAMRVHDYLRASACALASQWATQVGARAQRLAAMISTGQRPA